MKKIITIVGARPQFIKAAAVSRQIAKQSDMQEIIVHTGQHFDANMSNIFFKEMQIPEPDYNLNINNLSHGAMTGKMLEKIEKILLIEKPDIVLIYGDTNSTIAGALAATKLHIRIAHVEAGLRSYNMQMPEEINRILTDRISNILFCPTNKAIDNLNKEGFQKFDCKIIKSGDVMLDTALYYSKYEKSLDIKLPAKFILATVHRAENTNEPNKLKAIFTAFEKIANDTPIIIPLHPRTRKLLEKNNITITNPNIKIIAPIGYLQMIYLLKRTALIMTDSGGLQKEAFFFKKPCITLRNETEWVELIDNNVNIIAGTNYNDIYNSYTKMISRKINFDINLYGNGKASEIIVENL